MGRPMTPMPMKPICMVIYPFCLFHFDDDGSAFDNIALLVVDVPYFARVGGSDGMLHFHGAEDYEYLALLHHVPVMRLNFDDGSGHRRGERFLRSGDAASTRGYVHVGRLAPLQAKQLPAQIDMCLAIDMLYVGLKLFCSPTKQHEVIAAGGIGDIFRRTVVNLDAPTVRYSPILQRVSGKR